MRLLFHMRKIGVARWGRWLRVGRVALFGLICALATPAAMSAQTPDQRRDTAIALWLADSEIAGLQALAALATEGDVQSQLLLGMIDKDAALQGPEVLALSRRARLALLRAPGGLSGRNWVHAAAAQGDARAKNWQAVWTLSADLTTAARFVALGESRAAARTLLALSQRQESGFAPEVLAQPWYPDTLLYLSHHRVLTDDMAPRLHPGDPQHRFGSAGQGARAALQDWLATSPVSLPLRAACAVVCPQSVAACTQALYLGIGSYDALLSHGTPVAGLIDEGRFAASPRGQAALARRIMLRRSTRMREAERLKLAALDSCAADWLARQYSAHTLRKMTAPPE